MAISLSLVCVTQLGAHVIRTFASARPQRAYKSVWEYTHTVGDLAQLESSAHGPNSTQWNNSVAICATMKNENATDVREWLLYYKYVFAVLICLKPACTVGLGLCDETEPGGSLAALDAIE